MKLEDKTNKRDVTNILVHPLPMTPTEKPSHGSVRKRLVRSNSFIVSADVKKQKQISTPDP